MIRLIGEHWEDDVRVRWYGDDATNEVTIERTQDPTAAIEHVAAVNAQGAPTLDGLGKPIAEVPVGAAIEYCGKRGIPWEKFVYGNEYDAEFKAFAREYSKLAYANTPSVYAVQ